MLFGSMVLEVAIGLIFVYLLLSLLCSAVSEYIESKLNYRSSDLQKGIRMLLNDPTGEGLSKTLYEHPLVKGLYRDGARLPSYIPSRTFMLALWNTATSAASGADASVAGVTDKLQDIRATVAAKIPDSEIRTAILTLIDEAGGNMTRAQHNIEEWYDSAMDRVSGWYKRRTQWILLVIGFTVAILINADTANIAKALVQDGALRSAVVGAASAANEDENFRNTATGNNGTPSADPAERAAAAKERVQNVRTQLSGLGLPVGWAWDKTIIQDPRGKPVDAGGWILKLIGLFITALAISQGAPFWFDLLNKFMVIRSTVKPHEKSREQPSKDKPAPDTELEGKTKEGKS